MSDMRKLLESISNFSFADPKAPKEKTAKPVSKKDKDDEEDLAESLMREYKYFVKEAPVVANAAPTTSSPVATINPAGGGNPAMASTTAPAPGTAAAGAQSQTTKPPVPGQPTPPANQAQPAGQAPKPGQPAGAAGTATPPNPQQVKQQTDAVTKMLNDPAHPMNAQLQALIKKAGSIPG